MAKIDKLLKRSKEHFEDGEEPLQIVLAGRDQAQPAVIRGSYEVEILGKDSVRAGILIATDRRLLFYAKKLTGYDLEAFPYANISSMEMGKNLMGHHISFFASGNKCKMKWIKGAIRPFVEAVREQIAGVKESAAPTSEQPMDPTDQLEKLGTLHASGVLTDDEFSAKKAEILARL